MKVKSNGHSRSESTADTRDTMGISGAGVYTRTHHLDSGMFSTESSSGEYYSLSGRESEILECITEGMTNKEIADRLFLSPETVKTYVSRMLKKLGARNRTEAVVRAIEIGNNMARSVLRGELAGNQ